MKYKSLAVLPLLLVIMLLGPVCQAGNNYTRLDGSLEKFKSAFNADQGKARLVMYVSPTCGGCLRGAKLSQQNLLAKTDNPDVSAYVIWAPRNGAREKHVDRVLDLVTDERATQYWDSQGVAAEAYDAMFDIEGRPCAGVFMLYDTNAVWTDDDPPIPEYYEDAHAREFAQKAGPQFNATRLLERLRLP